MNTPHQSANGWRSGAGASQSRERFFLRLPRLDATTMQICLDLVADVHTETFHVMLMDQRGFHTVTWLRIPDTMALVFVALACPERNLIERLWADLRSKLAGQCFAHRDCLEDDICAHLDQYTDPVVPSLTGYSSLREVMNAVCS